MTSTSICDSQHRRERGTPTVLLIDDDANTLVALTAVLDGRGLRILDAESPEGALHWCQTANADIDVFVVDVILQAANGPELVTRLRQAQPAARVLFISGFELSELRKRGLLSSQNLSQGSVEFLQKPFGPEAFASAVERLVASGRPKDTVN